MDDVLLRQVFDALVHFVDQLAGVLLVERALGSDFTLDVAAVAQLGDDVAVIGAGEHLQTIEDVRMFERL